MKLFFNCIFNCIFTSISLILLLNNQFKLTRVPYFMKTTRSDNVVNKIAILFSLNKYILRKIRESIFSILYASGSLFFIPINQMVPRERIFLDAIALCRYYHSSLFNIWEKSSGHRRRGEIRFLDDI